MVPQMNKREFIINTVLALKGATNDERIKVDFDKLLDTIAHAAPELLDQRWMNVYYICSSHLTDMENESHTTCYSIYENRLKEYKSQFKN